MALKQIPGSVSAPDGSRYVVLTDGAGNLSGAPVGTGGQGVTLQGSTGTAINGVVTNADAIAAASTGSYLGTAAETYIFNGTSWDRMRGASGVSQTAPLGLLGTALVPHTTANTGIAYTTTTVASGSIILKATAGNLFSVNCTAGASAGYLMIFDSATVPADGTVTPAFSVAIAANASYTNDWAYPIRGTAGLVLVFSTTGPYTKTISATAQLGGQFI